MSSANLLRVQSVSLQSVSLLKMLKITGVKIDPWGTLLITSLHPDTELLSSGYDQPTNYEIVKNIEHLPIL